MTDAPKSEAAALPTTAWQMDDGGFGNSFISAYAKDANSESAWTQQYNRALTPITEAQAIIDRKSDALQRLWRERDELRAELAALKSAQPAEQIPLSAIRPIAVEAIRAITGCPDVLAGERSLVDELESVAQAAAKTFAAQPADVARDAARYRWLRAHSFLLGASSVEFGAGFMQRKPELLDAQLDAAKGEQS